MLVNRSVWICLLFLFVIYGCGVSRNEFNEFKFDVELNSVTKKELGHVESQLQTIEGKLQKVVEAHENTKKELDDVESQLQTTEGKLQKVVEAHENTKQKLDDVESQLQTTEGKLQKVVEAHENTKQKLDDVESRLKTAEDKLQQTDKRLNSVVKAHENTKEELADIMGERNKLLDLKEPSIEDYFDLGKALIKQAEGERNLTKMKELIDRAINRLHKVTVPNNDYSVDAYCYIAKAAYYKKNEYVEAHKAVLRANELVKQGYPKNPEIFKDAQKVLRSTKVAYDEYMEKLKIERSKNTR